MTDLIDDLERELAGTGKKALEHLRRSFHAKDPASIPVPGSRPAVKVKTCYILSKISIFIPSVVGLVSHTRSIGANAHGDEGRQRSDVLLHVTT